ncbi:MAG: hypothetical protein IPK76_06720 [Lewinellaceae bacterium]|nr:hypothetical protein [Lewinellaceae bacterium]
MQEKLPIRSLVRWLKEHLSGVSRGKDDIPTDRSKSSNEFGEYIIVIPAGHTFTFINVYKSGFLPNIFPLKGIDIQEGDTNVVNIQLIPTDGFLKLILKNDTGQQDSVYIKICSPIAISEGLGVETTSNYPQIIQDGEVYTEHFSFPSEDTITIYWKFENFVIPNTTFHTSMYLTPGDTSVHLIIL